jgi:uridylate kinase
VLLKLSGEGLAGPKASGIDAEQMARIVSEIREVHAAGAEVAIVVGGGNILRGATFAEQSAIPAATAHHMGMLATVINALAIQESLEAEGLEARVLSSISIASICEPWSRRACMRHLDKGRIAILAGGTGRPFVTTDTAAALGAVEIGADALLKATQVDGVYDADPRKIPDAKLYRKLNYDKVIDERLGVMDISAIHICQENGMPIVVFNLHKPGNLLRAVRGEQIGTAIAEQY